jgi:hypothetical protein
MYLCMCVAGDQMQGLAIAKHKFYHCTISPACYLWYFYCYIKVSNSVDVCNILVDAVTLGQSICLNHIHSNFFIINIKYPTIG